MLPLLRLIINVIHKWGTSIVSTSNIDQVIETGCLIAKQQHLEQAMEFIPGRVNSSLRAVEPRLVPVRAEGAYFYDMDGTRYLDYHGAFGPPILGHSHPAVTKRVKAAIEETDQVGVGIGPLEIELARKIVQHIPSGTRPCCAIRGVRRRITRSACRAR